MTESPTVLAVVTGSRADFGLLRPVIGALRAEPSLRCDVVVSGLHLLPGAASLGDVEGLFPVAAKVEMQRADVTGRGADVAALARGVAGFGEAFESLGTEIVLVLGDRIEAFAAASAASVGGRLLAHIHGGDRAEGVADEAMRHAISKLAQIHFPATALSAARLGQMGEHDRDIHIVGSPAMDDLDTFAAMDDAALSELGVNVHRRLVVVLHHPTGLSDEEETQTARAILDAVNSLGDEYASVLLAPNHDPGYVAVRAVLKNVRIVNHLPRAEFVGLLRRAWCLVGNSSSGLIECAALRVPAINIGPRQNGRERADNVVDVENVDAQHIARAIREAGNVNPTGKHHYGHAGAGERIAAALARIAVNRPSVRKRNAY